MRAVHLAALLGLALAAASCRPGSTPPPPDSPAHRIVSLSPPFTETIFALGRGDRLVGRTAYCDTPPEATALPVAGDAVQVSVETLLRLRPDLILTQSRGLLDQLGPLRDRFRVRYVPDETVEEVLASIGTIGRLVEAPDEAAALVARIRGAMEEARLRSAGRPRPRVLVVHDRDPFVVAGPRSYVGALLDLAGGENAAGDREAPYPQISPETIVARRPEILIDATHGTDEEAARAYWSSRFPDLPAVRAGRVRALAETAVLRPGPRIPEALRALEALLRPEDDR